MSDSPPDPCSAYEALMVKLTDPAMSEQEPRLFAVGMEMESLRAIYGDTALRLHIEGVDVNGKQAEDVPSKGSRSSEKAVGQFTNDEVNELADNLKHVLGLSLSERIKYEIVVPLFEHTNLASTSAHTLDRHPVSKEEDNPDSVMLRVLVSLPPTYPETAAPQLQLMGRYLGTFALDRDLFERVTKTFITESDGVAFSPGDVCVFDGVENVLEHCRSWYTAKDQERKTNERQREQERASRVSVAPGPESSQDKSNDGSSTTSQADPPPINRSFSEQDSVHLDDGNAIEIYTADPITASRSVFVGHACRVTDILQVPLVIHRLLSDKRIAKAAHPVMHAYRIVRQPEVEERSKIVIADNDDDGETAAGGRLQHLLQILDLENVLVVVTRWYGGILLGPLRFSLINQAARAALEKAGFMDEDKSSANSKKGGKK